MLARSLLRSAPRLSSSALSLSRNAARPLSIAQSLRPITRVQLPRIAAFSTSFRRQENNQELSAKLENEIQIENENLEKAKSEAGYDDNIKNFLDQGIWEVEDRTGYEEVVLKRTYNDETIRVAFSIADFNTQDPPDSEADEALMDEDDGELNAQSGGANTKGAVSQGRTSGGNIKVGPEDEVTPADREELEDDEDDRAAFPARVNVSVTRPGKGSLNLSLQTSDGELLIEGVAYLPEGLAEQETAEAEYTKQTLYTGPPFQQLDEELQMLMERFLEERGVNTSLALFIPEYIDRKEMTEYLAWLEKVKKFVD